VSEYISLNKLHGLDAELYVKTVYARCARCGRYRECKADEKNLVICPCYCCVVLTVGVVDADDRCSCKARGCDASPCKGTCGCDGCADDYSEFLSSRDE
jgi:hypothetical protein